MNKIVNFHLPASDPARAARFYGEVFGWTFAQQGAPEVPYLVHDGAADGGAGVFAAIVERQEIVKAPVPTIEVAAIDDAMATIATRGGQQGRVNRIEGIGRFGYAIDSEGNVIALLERDR